jgi:hypothetical protein
VAALASADTGSGRVLVAGGWFTLAGAAPAAGLAAWNGGSWYELGGGVSGGGLLNGVNALADWDDGTGPGLCVGGLFLQAGGLAVSSVARWNDAPPRAYCTAGVSSAGCAAAISSTGAPSASAGAGFDVTVGGAEGARFGAVVLSASGAQALPFGNGVLCLQPPLRILGAVKTGGAAGACDGSLGVDVNAWMAAHPGSAPPAGSSVWFQGWVRDPVTAAGVSLSDALAASVCP